jgi:hypothetical protein
MVKGKKGLILFALTAVLLSLTGCQFFADTNDIVDIHLFVNREQIDDFEYQLDFGEEISLNVEVVDFFGQEVNNCTVKWYVEEIGSVEPDEGYSTVFTAVKAGEGEYIEGTLDIYVESLKGAVLEESLNIIVGTKPTEK